MLDVLHVICTRLRLGLLSVHVGDGSRRSEEIVKNLELRLSMRLSSLLLLSPGWPRGKPFASWAADSGLILAFARDLFIRPRHTSDLTIGTPVATLPGASRRVIGLASEPVGPVSVHCDWVRQKV